VLDLKQKHARLKSSYPAVPPSNAGTPV
jgi:hypothetical protein